MPAATAAKVPQPPVFAELAASLFGHGTRLTHAAHCPARHSGGSGGGGGFPRPQAIHRAAVPVPVPLSGSGRRVQPAPYLTGALRSIALMPTV